MLTIETVEGAIRPTFRNPLKRTFIFLSLLSLTFLILLATRGQSNYFKIFTLTQNVYVKDTSRPSQAANHVYAIVFDAGSTGTRIHVFEFRRKEDGELKLLTEIFREKKPGLSSFANNIVKVEESVLDLLKPAFQAIPELKWKETPITLKATAGLRLLPGRKSKMILQQVRKTLASSPFKSDGMKSASIMDGDDEGLYAWETVNFLLGKFKRSGSRNTYGVVDVGGGSFQVTYAIPEMGNEHEHSQNMYVRNVRFDRQDFRIYDHSYLGLGLMSARSSLLNLTFVDSVAGSNQVKVVNPCFPRGFSKSWTFNGIEYIISGSDQCSFESCREVAKIVVSTIKKPDNFEKSKIFLLSYFFDRAVEAGLIDSKAGGELQVEDYIDSAQTICQRGNVNDHPFFCLDMTYLSTLLTDGFGLGLHKRLLLRNKIHGFEVSWALGVALSLQS